MTRLLLKNRVDFWNDSLQRTNPRYESVILNFDYVISAVESENNYTKTKSCLVTVAEGNHKKEYIIDIPISELWEALEKLEAKRR